MKSFNTRKLGALTTLISSGSTPLGGSQNYQAAGPVMFVRSQNVLMNRLDLSDVAYVTDEIHDGMRRTWVQQWDVLLNITGASIGRVAVFEIPGAKANVNQHVCILRPKPDLLDSRFLAHFISTPTFQRKIAGIENGGTRQALTFGQIADFDLPVLSLEDQKTNRHVPR